MDPRDPNFIWAPDTTQEVKDQYVEQWLTEQATATDRSHAMSRFFTEMELDQLQLFARVMTNVISGVVSPWYYQGLATAAMQNKGYCVACAVNHDDELKAATG